MNQVAEAIQGLINRPARVELAVAFGVSLALLLVGVIVLLASRRRWVAVTLGSLGLVGALTVLLIVDLQTITFREGQNVTVTRPKFREKERAMARGGMITLPSVVVGIGLIAWAVSRRRLRRGIPGLIRTGRRHLFHEEYPEARECFNRAIRIMPYLSEGYCGRAEAHQGLGDVEHALKDYDRAIQLDPRHTHALIHRARLHTEAGDPDRALVDLIRVMEIQPNDPELYLNRGLCYFKKGQMDKATSDLHRVLKLTNHTDFAEPANALLSQIESTAPGLPFEPGAPLPSPSPESNGVPRTAALHEPKAEDHTA